MSPVYKTADLPDKLTIPYLERGNESGLAVLMLHGVTDSLHSFDLVLPHLPEVIHALALTQRGHGDASRPDSGYRYADLARDVAAFMNVLQLKTAVVVGHSMGSSVAQRFAIDYPERTLGLVLVASFTTLRGHPAVQELWDSAISTMTDPVDPSFVREFQQSTIAQQVPQEFFEKAVRESLKLPARVWRSLFLGFLEDDFSMKLSEIKAPTLVVWGDRDAFCSRRDQHKLMGSIPNARLLIYPGVGHAVHWEQPARFARDLFSFVEGLAQ